MLRKLTLLALVFAAFISTAHAQPLTTKPSFTDMLTANCTAAHVLIGGAVSPGCGPTPTRAGDIMYYNGSAWVSLAGNNSGTQFLQETSVGLPSWATVSGSGTVTSVTCFGTAITTSGTCTTTGQIPGTATNDNASAGNVGEVIDGSAALGAVSLTSGAGANITSISLTAGDWEVYSTVYFTPAGTTTVTILQASTNTTSATIDASPGNFGEFILNNTILSSGSNIMSVTPGQPKRYSLSTTTTVFLTADQVFANSTMTAGGKIHAIRTR
jgi:hypothetical protein